jgi:hypothetical protein
MRCEDVRKKLEIDARVSRLAEDVRTHLLECPDCRQMQAAYAGIERELQEQPAWEPPPGFVQRVGLQGFASLSAAPARPRILFWGNVGPALAAYVRPLLLGLLAATFSMLFLYGMNALDTGYPRMAAAVTAALLDNVIPLAWITSILSLCLSLFLTRRALG